MFRAVRVLITVKALRPDYFKVKAYYKTKRYTTVLWATEWTSIFLFGTILNEELTQIVIYSPLNLLGLLIDSYFLCLIYMCYTKGLNGDFGDRTIDGISVNVITTISNDIVPSDAVVAESVKERQAVPYEFDENPPPPAEVTRIIDFTKVCEGLSKNNETIK